MEHVLKENVLVKMDIQVLIVKLLMLVTKMIVINMVNVQKENVHVNLLIQVLNVKHLIHALAMIVVVMVHVTENVSVIKAGLVKNVKKLIYV